MQGPNDSLRGAVAERIGILDNAQDPEAALEGLLSTILAQVTNDTPAQLQTDEDAYVELAAIESWASLASHAVQALYAPSSPRWFDEIKQSRHETKLAGWCKGAAEKLRKIAASL